jgi:hypothetical protein
MRYAILVTCLLALAACSGPAPTAQQLRERCLFAAIAAYPATPIDATHALLDTIPECSSLPAEDKTLLRSMVADFVSASNRALGEES